MKPLRYRGPFWMPITPETGSLFHADPHLAGMTQPLTIRNAHPGVKRLRSILPGWLGGPVPYECRHVRAGGAPFMHELFHPERVSAPGTGRWSRASRAASV